MNQQGGSRGNGHLWAGECVGTAASAVRRGEAPPRSGIRGCGKRRRWRAALAWTAEAAVPTGILSSESYEHRFWFEWNPPRFLHAVLDFVFQADNIARLRISPV